MVLSYAADICAASALCWLNGRNCSDTREDMEGCRQPGSCQWILDRPEMQNWLQDDSAHVFWLHGAPGCGKSFLYSRLIDQLESTQPTMYFFFRGEDKQRSTFSSLLQSWTLQLIEANRTALDFLVLIRNRKGNPTATEKEVLELFYMILDQVPSCYLTVDAFDECSDGGDFFRRLSFVPKRFRILATSRTPASPRRDVAQSQLTIQQFEIHAEMLQKDINRFVAATVDDLVIGCSEETIRQIQHRLRQNDGMFLWVKLMLDQIRDQTCEYDILAALNELPDGLPETYDRIMNRINSLKKARRLLAFRVFFWIITVRRPVSVVELRTLLAIQPQLKKFDERRLILDGETTIHDICGGLVQFRHLAQRAFFIHFTVTQYLSSYLSQQHVHHEIMSSYDMANLETNDALAAAVCVQYLTYEGLESLVTPTSHTQAMTLFNKKNPRTSLLFYAVSHWFQHLMLADTSEEHVWEIATQFLAKDSFNRDFSWQLSWFASPASLESKVCPTQFSGLHIASYFGLTHLVDLLIPMSSLDLRASWDRSPLWWAVSREHADVSDRLVKAGFDPQAGDRDLISPSHRAAALGNLETLKPSPQRLLELRLHFEIERVGLPFIGQHLAGI